MRASILFRNGCRDFTFFRIFAAGKEILTFYYNLIISNRKQEFYCCIDNGNGHITHSHRVFEGSGAQTGRGLAQRIWAYDNAIEEAVIEYDRCFNVQHNEDNNI